MNPMYFADTGDNQRRHLPEVGSGGTGNYFDYDIPPEALADEQFAAMMAEAEKYLGYPYVWGGASLPLPLTVPAMCLGDQQLRRWLEFRKADRGWSFRCMYAGIKCGCKTRRLDLLPGNLQYQRRKHVGIYVGNGMMIHCGDPISYANINTSYWQQHFYCYGRLP